MSIRDDLIRIIAKNMYGDPVPDLDPDAPAEMWDPAETDEVLTTADAVLDWLGQLDPDADPELIALHLRDSRKEMEGLRRQLETSRRRLAGEQKRVNNQAKSIQQYQQEIAEARGLATRVREVWGSDHPEVRYAIGKLLNCAALEAEPTDRG